MPQHSQPSSLPSAETFAGDQNTSETLATGTQDHWTSPNSEAARNSEYHYPQSHRYIPDAVAPSQAPYREYSLEEIETTVGPPLKDAGTISVSDFMHAAPATASPDLQHTSGTAGSSTQARRTAYDSYLPFMDFAKPYAGTGVPMLDVIKRFNTGRQKSDQIPRSTGQRWLKEHNDRNPSNPIGAVPKNGPKIR